MSDYDAIYSQDFSTEDISSGWIQWKGTDACVDLHCVCGHLGHIDADFFYRYECVGCGRKFAVGQNIKLIELTPEQVSEDDDFHKDEPAGIAVENHATATISPQADNEMIDNPP